MSGATIQAPFAGTLKSIQDVPDPVFAEEIVGPGIALQPENVNGVKVHSPLTGRIVKVHPHAFVVSDGTTNVLVHLGLDTVKRDGKGFTVLAQQNDDVEAGQVLIEWNPQEISEDGLHTICPIVFLDSDKQVNNLVDFGTTVDAHAEIASV